MKRSAEWLQVRDIKPRRQDPVSCEFCRKKKLKCDRGAPCSNCRARRLPCSSVGDLQSSTSNFVDLTDSSVASTSLEELNARLTNIEEILGSKAKSSLQVDEDLKKPKIFTRDEREFKNEGSKISKEIVWLETDALEHSSISPNNNELTSDTTVGSHNDPTLDLNIRSMLPTRSCAYSLFDFFTKYINWIHHIIHIPTAKAHLDQLYNRLEHKQQIDHRHVALISTIFALSAYFATPFTRLQFPYSEASFYCQQWTWLA